MRKSMFTRFLCFVLVVSMTLGQGSLGAMAMPMMHMEKTASASMAGMNMSTSMQKDMDCCTHGNLKSKTMKGGMCDACCAAVMHAAMLPFQSSVPVQYAVAYSYDLTDTTAVSKILPPEPPPPKA
jgi:hypothetical protein